MNQPTLGVAHLIKGLGPGGAERLIVNQCRASDADDIEYRVAYLLDWKDHLVGELTDAGVETECLGGGRRLGLRWALRLRRALRRVPAAVLHVHSPAPAAVARLLVRTLPRRSRPALVYTEHNRWPRHGTVTRWLNRLTVRLDDLDLAVSADVVASMPARIGERFAVVTHGVDLEDVRGHLRDRDAARAELGIDARDVVIGTVANLRREKAYEVLLEAAAAAVRAEPRLRFVTVGQGPLADEVAALHEASGLGDRFVLLGYRADAVRVMSAFDVFTLASRHEGLPVALMDALALGLPVAATRAGGIPDAVDHDVSGLLVDVDDAAGLAAAHVALADTTLRNRMAAAAGAGAVRFDARRATSEIEARYRGLVASNAS